MKEKLVFSLVFSLFCFSCSISQLDEPETLGYTLQEEDVNYTIVILKKGKVHLEGNIMENGVQYLDLVKQFNQNQEEALQMLRLSMIALGKKETDLIPIITIRRFSDFDKAGQYAGQLEKYYTENSADIAAVYPISQSNYRNLISRRDLREYQRFYNMTAAVK